MTFATVRGAAEHAAKQGKLSPHQLAALSALDEALTDQQRQAFTDAWRSEGSPANLADPLWLKPALKIIKEFEGLRLEAYRCPAGVPTIGYGATRMIDKPVRMGDKITKEFAEELLENQVVNLFAPGLFALLPLAKKWRPEQQAALVSWAFNIGLGAVEDSTLRKRLLAGEDPSKVVAEELPRWNKGDNGVLEGLKRRRAAEVALFLGGQPAKAPEMVAPAGSRPHLRLTRTKKKDGRGLDLLRLQYVKAGQAVDTLEVVSGAPGAQQFRTGAESKAGSLEPLPEGRWGIEDVAWAKGKDNYSGSWGPGLGPASVPLRYLGPGHTERSAIEIHYDANASMSPGTAGCIGMRSVADLKTLIGWLRDTDPRDLFADYGLGTCPAVKG
jgi:GH24 family phage-related lysozyme (muramidase)